MRGKSKYLPLLAISLDVILLFNAFLTAGYLVFNGNFPFPEFYIELFLGWALLWIIIAIRMKLFDLPRILYLDLIVANNIKALALFIVICAFCIYMVTDNKFPKLFFVAGVGLFSIMVVLWHAMLVLLFKAYRRKGNNFRNVAIVGFKKPAEKLIKEVLMVPENGFQFQGIYAEEQPPEALRQFYKGKETSLLNKKGSSELDELYIALPGDQSSLINDYMKFADNNMIRVHILPNFSSYLYQNFAMDYVHNIPLLQLRQEPLESLSNRIVKRIFDLVFSLGVIVLIGLWLFPIIAVLIKASSRGPVLFKQKRSGKDGHDFTCLKFRSMTLNTESNSQQATQDDARVTGIGRFLRKTSIDELPQFINVLKDDMSVVGPRPHMLKHTDEYQEMVEKYMVRHFAKPGITGMAQVKGFRGQIKDLQDIKNRAEADIWYIENWTIFLDLKIVLRTALQVIFTKEKNAF